MPKQASLLVLAAVGLAAALYFTLRADLKVNEVATSDPASSSVIESVAHAAEPAEDIEAVARLSSEKILGTDAEGRAEVAAGHRIQVKFADGSPAAGVRVQTFIPEAGQATEILAFWREHRTEILWWNDKLEYTLADAEGFVRLPTYSRAVVSVASEFGVGHLVFEASDAEQAETRVLQLRSVPMIEVQVLGAEGELVHTGYRVEAHVAESGREDRVSFSSGTVRVGTVWKRHLGVGKLDDGRRVMSMQLGSHTQEQLGEVDAPVRYRLSLRGGYTEHEPREFDASEPGPIVFQLPATGSMAVQLQGYPEGATPFLRLVSSVDAHFSEQPGTLSDDGAWHEFDSLPIGREFEVMIYARGPNRGPNVRHTRTNLAGAVVTGPAIAGERVEQQVNFQPQPGLHGRFLIPQDLAMPIDAFVAFANRANQSVRFSYGEGRHRFETANCTVFADGRFFIPLERLQNRSVEPHRITTLMVQWVEPRPSSREGSTPWVPERLWATRSLALDSYDTAVDLGEIPLLNANPLMRVKVIGPAGEPIPNVSIDLAAMSAAEQRSEAFRGSSVHLAQTDDLGETWVLGQDWYSILRFENPKLGAALQPHEQLLAVRFLARHESLAEASVVLLASELNRDTIEITMASAGSIHGSVNFLHDLDGVDLVVLPVGSTDVKNWRQTGVYPQRIDMRDRSDFNPRAFRVQAVPPGEWDLVFTVPNQSELQLLRVPRVFVAANEECHDPRLQGIELGNALGFLRFRFRDGAGRLLNGETTQAYHPTVWFMEENGRGATGQGANWTQDQLVYPLPVGETASITFEAEGWETKIFTSVTAQDFEVTVRRIPVRQVIIQGLGEIPEGLTLGFSLNRPDDYFGSGMWNSSQTGPAEIQLKSAGDFAVHWALRNEDEVIAHGKAQITVTEGELFSDAPLELELPEQIKEYLNPN